MSNTSGKRYCSIFIILLLSMVGCKEKGLDQLTKGIFLQTDGRYKEAIPCFDEAIKANPSLLPAYSNMMECWFQLEKGDSIVDACGKIHNDDKGDPINLFTYGYALRLHGELDSSLFFLNNALNKGLKDSWIYYAIGNIHDIRNDASKAREYYEKSDEGLAFIRLASLESDESKKIKYYVKSMDNLIDKAGGYYALALYYLERGKKNEADEWLKKASDWGFAKKIKYWQNIHLAAPLVYLADELTAQVLLNMAIEKYREAIKLKEDWAYVHGRLGGAYFRAGDYDNAVRECERALALSANHTPALATLVAVYVLRNQYPLAETYYQKHMEIDPCRFDHANLATLYTNKKEYNRALAAIDKGLGIFPQDCRFFYMKGNIRLLQKKYDDAINDYRQALSYKTNDNFFNCDLYQVYTKAFALRDLQKGKYLYQATKDTCLLYSKKAIAADPENIRAQELYNSILSFKTREEMPTKGKRRIKK